MRLAICTLVAALLSVACSTPTQRDAPESAIASPTDASALQPVAVFAAIRDRDERSVALFVEAGRVFQHPRCLNCHPRERSPTQGDDLHAHVPPIDATASGHGLSALACTTCHSTANVRTEADSVRSIPGHPHWALAPASMAWQGASLQEICEQIQDRRRNGDRSLDAILEHVSHDTLVGWAWSPGEGRASAPGTQQAFGELVGAWIRSGARCPRA